MPNAQYYREQADALRRLARVSRKRRRLGGFLRRVYAGESLRSSAIRNTHREWDALSQKYRQSSPAPA
jgi:hypothetical protein